MYLYEGAHSLFIFFLICFFFNRILREKTSLAVTSKGRFGSEEERGSGGTSTRRRLAPRSLATMSVSGHESVMVQTLRLEEQQRAKEEKRLVCKCVFHFRLKVNL